jgi:hypothetical protein
MAAPAGRPHVLSASLNRGTLGAVFQAYESYLQAAYLESETRIELLAATDEQVLGRLNRWTHGRVFGPDLEIRWQRDDLTYQVLALFEGDTLMPRGTLTVTPITQWDASPIHARLDDAARERTIRLLGVNVAALPPDHPLYDRAGGAWVSDQAGRLLRYPVRDPLATRVGLRCLDYLHHGSPVLTRLCALVPIDQGP